MLISTLQEIGHRAALDILADNERSAVLLSDVIDSYNLRMTTESRHGLCFADKAGDAISAQLISFEKSDDHVSIQTVIASQIDLLLPSLSEWTPDKIAARGERCRHTPGLRVDAGPYSQRISVIVLTHGSPIKSLQSHLTFPGPQSARPGFASVCSP